MVERGKAVKLGFVKMVGAGNDFVVIDSRPKNSSARRLRERRLSGLAVILCRRKTGIGADGLLVLERSKKAHLKMRVFNADGSEAEMCGNGLRCAALCAKKRGKIKIETKAGMYEAAVTGRDKVRIKMEGVKDIERDVSVRLNNRPLRMTYADSGVPHAVVFVQGLKGIDVETLGREIRYHKRFRPRGANVDFVEIVDDKNINIRTYERGVEGETFACGTGAVASAVAGSVMRQLSQASRPEINVHTAGGVLKVCFNRKAGGISDVCLEGEAKIVYKGEVDYV